MQEKQIDNTTNDCFFLSLNGPTGPIQSLIRDVRLCVVSVSVPLFLFFLNVLLLPFTKVKSQIDRIQKDSLRKSYETTLVSDLEILA